jgi:predicted metal-dependent phosphoesterase TrpH
MISTGDHNDEAGEQGLDSLNDSSGYGVTFGASLISMPSIKVDLHCHTVFSKDGLIEFDSLVRAAEQIGLDAMAVTDHDTIAGARDFQRRAVERGLHLQIIVGEEKTLSDGSHLIGLFLSSPIQSGDLKEAIREITGQDGLCLIPHPFRKKDGLLRDGLERLRFFEGLNAGFELFSAKCSAADNARARELLGLGLAPFGGSDAHYESDLGEAMNVIRWDGDLKTSIERMFQRRAPFQILGKVQTGVQPERAYAPLYYRLRKYLKLPETVLPAAKQCYRWYRNTRHGVGAKPLVQVYAHA